MSNSRAQSQEQVAGADDEETRLTRMRRVQGRAVLATGLANMAFLGLVSIWLVAWPRPLAALLSDDPGVLEMYRDLAEVDVVGHRQRARIRIELNRRHRLPRKQTAAARESGRK